MCKGEEKMNKKDLKLLQIFTISCVVLSIVSFLLSISNLYLSTHKPQKKLELQDISKTENNLTLHIDDQELHIPKEKLEEYFLIDLEDIVDWNTNGDEIAISLCNGCEYYTTKTKNIYTPKFKNYVGFDEIFSVRETETGFEIVTKDGNVYTINK